MNKMTIIKHIPARVDILSATWCVLDAIRMNDTFRKARREHKRRLNRCYVCGHHFEDDEMMALAAFDRIGNRTLCRSCATKLIESSNDGS